MNFRKIEISDKKRIDSFVARFGGLGSDYSFGSWFSWYSFDTMELCEEDDSLFIKADLQGETVFLSPLTADFEGSLKLIKEYCRQNNLDFKVVFATKEQTAGLLCYKIVFNRDNAEYLYAPSDLIELAGKKYHGKRNHIARFKEGCNTYKFLPYEDKYFDDALALLDNWAKERGGVDAEEERGAFIKMLKNLEALDLLADVIEKDGKLVAVTVGEITAQNVGVVLFEKVYSECEGTYAAINQMFAEKHFKNVRFINRQEDMGLDGLRRAKESYHPVQLVEKATITLPDSEQLKDLYKNSFDDTNAYIEYFLAKKVNEAEVFKTERDGQILSALYCFKKGLVLGGGYLQGRFITAAATLPRLRGKGVMAGAITDALKKLYADGTPIIMLEPYKQDYYTRYGFSTITYVSKVKAKCSGKNLLFESKTSDAKKLKEAYDNFCYGYDFYIDRTELDFESRLAEAAADNGVSTVVLDGEKPIGYYIVIDGEVEECVLSQKMLSKVKGLDGKNVVVPLGEEGSAQARIVNLYKLVEGLNLPKGFNKNIKIFDSIFSANSGVFNLREQEGRGRLDAAESFEIEVSIGELLQGLLGLNKSLGVKPLNGFVVDRY